MINNEESRLRALRELEQEHQDLHEIINTPDSHSKFLEFTIQKLKKRKLLLKDKIKLIKASLPPDIIA